MAEKEYIERGKAIEALTVDFWEHYSGCHSSSDVDVFEAMSEIISQTPAADVAPVVHGEWIATTKHKWKTRYDGEIDEFAWDREFHNGPVCTICGSAPCVHCRPGWKDDEGCYEHFVCSVCGEHEEKKYPYCHCGAKMDGGKNETD